MDFDPSGVSIVRFPLRPGGPRLLVDVPDTFTYVGSSLPRSQEISAVMRNAMEVFT